MFTRCGRVKLDFSQRVKDLAARSRHPSHHALTMIVRAIGAKVVSVSRITMRDSTTYCSIFLDDNNRKPILRLYFNAKNSKSVGVFTAQPDKAETRHTINDVSNIYSFAQSIEATIKNCR